MSFNFIFQAPVSVGGGDVLEAGSVSPVRSRVNTIYDNQAALRDPDKVTRRSLLHLQQFATCFGRGYRNIVCTNLL